MELIQCSELSSRLTDLNKIQEHITPQGHPWPRARVGCHPPAVPPCLPLGGGPPPNQPQGFGVPSPPLCSHTRAASASWGDLVPPKHPAHPQGSFPAGLMGLGLDQDKAERDLQQREIPGGPLCDRDRRNQIF